MRDALEATYRRHHDRLRRLASQLAPYDADDIVQDAFVQALQYGDRFRYEAGLPTWLYRIVVNGCISRHRRRRVRTRFDATIRRGTADLVRPISVEAIQIRSALRVLSRQQYLVLILHDAFGYTHAEIARRLGIPVGTSKWRLQVGRRHLRTLLSTGVRAYSQECTNVQHSLY